MTLMLILSALSVAIVQAIASWRPVITPFQASASILHQEATLFGSPPAQSLYDIESTFLGHEHDRCTLYKVAMNQQFYFEYIHYKMEFPDMREFTLCMWTKFYNHTNDHPLFSYAVGDQPRGILSWVANTRRSSYYMMNVDGHNLYRLNYPLRLNKWYHSCQSWNGRTGEWQIWVNDERVGRGFNNRLVGHVIKGGGIAISGQEQRQLGGGFLEGEGAPKGSGGYLGEITMVQLYSVALTAGKAHKDHKHHHGHHYDHDTSNNTPRTTTRAPVTGPPLPQHPFLTGGQINPQLPLNIGSPLQIMKNGVTLRHPGLPPPRQPQLLPPINPDALTTALPTLPPQIYGNPVQSLAVANMAPTTVTFVSRPFHNIFKREENASDEKVEDKEPSEESRKVKKRETEDQVKSDASDEAKSESDSSEKKLEKRESAKKKRGLIQLADGGIYDDGFPVSQGLETNYLAGLANFGPHTMKYEEEDEREPAEAEVKQVMDICDGCSDEPFEKALIMAWRSVPKKLYSGATHVPARSMCKGF